jgi:hypothetical protein
MQIGPGLDTCWHQTPAWALFQAQVCSILEPWDPIVGGLDPIPGVWLAHMEVLDQPWRSGLYIQGSGALPWGPDLLLMPWSISPSLDTWRLRTRPCGGVGHCCGPRVVAETGASHGLVPHTTPLPRD